MKLSKAVMSFPADNKSVVLAIPGTDYSTTLTLVNYKGQPCIKSLVSPAKYTTGETFEGEMPDELEMLVAQAHMFNQSVGHYLACETHRDAVRVELGIMHSRIEKAKVKMPHLMEMSIIGESMHLTTGLPLQLLVMMGTIAKQVESHPNEFEQKLLVAQMEGKSSFEDHPEDDVVLDFDPVNPIPTAEQVAQYERDLAAQQVEQGATVSGSAALH